jgi:hypothetical protein
LLLRDCLIREDGETLVIGSGIPASWMDKPFTVRHMPTYFGEVSLSYDPQLKELQVSVERIPAGGIRHELPTEAALKIVEKL